MERKNDDQEDLIDLALDQLSDFKSFRERKELVLSRIQRTNAGPSNQTLDKQPAAAATAPAPAEKDISFKKQSRWDNDEIAPGIVNETKREAQSETHNIQKAHKQQHKLVTELNEADDPELISFLSQVAEKEAQIVRDLNSKPALRALQERAGNIQHRKPLESRWKPPQCLLDMTKEQMQKRRQICNIELISDLYIRRDDEDELVDPPLCVSFREMKLPPALQQALAHKGVTKPTRVQMQAIPAALSSRDMIAVASTGGGKTYAFGIPLICTIWNMELAVPIERKEGPFALVLAPSRELANQIFSVLSELVDLTVDYHNERKTKRRRDEDYPKRDGPGALKQGCFGKDRRSHRILDLHGMQLVGGGSLSDQLKPYYAHGAHFAVGTPGRVLDTLRQKKINLHSCRLLVLDEADRLIDTKFEADVRTIVDFFKNQRQTLMFSATMAPKLANFASSSLVKPIQISADRAGVANSRISQYIVILQSESDTIPALLLALKATAPPVLIFSDSPRVVDDTHLLLLEKGVRACTIHGALDQDERNEAMRKFRAGEKDVLVASDVAAKGLDFARIRHVINIGIPKEIENYVHRIGRTGRNGKRGRATTLLNLRECSVPVLRDLVQLLVQAKQLVPTELQGLIPEKGNNVEGASTPSHDVCKAGSDLGILSRQQLYSLYLEQPENEKVALLDTQLASRMINDVRGCAYCGGLGHRVRTCQRMKHDIAIAEKEAGSGAANERFNADRAGTRGYGGEW